MNNDTVDQPETTPPKPNIQQSVLDLLATLIRGCDECILEEVGTKVPFVICVFPEGKTVAMASNFDPAVATDALIALGRNLKEQKEAPDADAATGH